MTMSYRPVLGLALLLATVPVLATPSGAAGAAVSLEPCHQYPLRQPVQCGEASVPLDPAEPESGELTLGFTLVQADPTQRSREAVLVLAGGPGQAAGELLYLADGVLGPTGNRQDLLFVDQRGTGESSALKCPRLDQEAVMPDAAELAEVCLSHLDFEPRHFTTLAAVADFEALRKALGYERWNLVGGSYGTRMGQVYMREHPEAIRSAVLDGVAPLDMLIGTAMGSDAQASLDGLLAECRAQPDCRDAFPGLAGRIDRLLADLADDPQTVEFTHPRHGERVTREVDRMGVASAVRGILYSRQGQRILPLLLWQASEGDLAGLVAMNESLGERTLDQMNIGLTLNILCNEDVGRATADDIPASESESFIGRGQVAYWQEACARWPSYEIPDDFRQFPGSDIPTLLISGELDPVAPPRYGEVLQEQLSNARHIVVPHGDHTVGMRGGTCMENIINDFIENADPGAVDAGCIDRKAAQPLFTSMTGFDNQAGEPEGEDHD